MKSISSLCVPAQNQSELSHARPIICAFKFGKVHLFVNLLDDSPIDGAEDLAGAATAGIAVQLESLSQFLVTVPVPSVAGVSLDNLALRADSGYVLVSGSVH